MTPEKAAGREGQVRFIIRVFTLHWRKIASFCLAGMVLAAFLGNTRPPRPTHRAGIGLLIKQLAWRNAGEHGSEPLFTFDTSASASVNRIDRTLLLKDTEEAVAGVSDDSSERVDDAEDRPSFSIRLMPWNERNTVDISVLAYDDDGALSAAKAAAEFFTVQLRKSVEREYAEVLALLREELERTTQQLEKASQEDATGTALLDRRMQVLLVRELDLRIGERAEAGLVHAALPPSLNRLESRPVDAAIGLIAGFLLGFGLALMLELMDTSIKREEDVKAALELSTIACVPQVTEPLRKRLLAPRNGDAESRGVLQKEGDDLKSLFSVAFSILSLNLEYAMFGRVCKVVAVTSAVPGEGKSTTAYYMARAVTQRWGRVLLIDGAGRRPIQHRNAGVEREPGLLAVLTGEIDVDAAIRPTSVDGLSVLAAGRADGMLRFDMASERMRETLEQLEKTFDLIIIDCPPVLVGTETLHLASHADTVLLVVSVNNARRETVKRAADLLQSACGHLAGVVLNGVATSKSFHYYYYYSPFGEKGQNEIKRWHNREPKRDTPAQDET